MARVATPDESQTTYFRASYSSASTLISNFTIIIKSDNNECILGNKLTIQNMHFANISVYIYLLEGVLGEMVRSNYLPTLSSTHLLLRRTPLHFLHCG